MSLLLFSVLAVLVCWVVNRLRKLGSREHGLPPGPPTFPLIGNLHIFPTSHAHLKFTEWAETYGDICSVKIGPATTVIISSARMMKECLELNSATTSGRPPMHIVDLVYRSNHLAFVGYGPGWRSRRKIAHLLLHKEASRVQIPLQVAEGSFLMYTLLQDPQGLFSNIRRYTASVALSMVFGVHCTTYDHPYIETFFKLTGEFEHLLRPGGLPPIGVFPFLKHIPEWWAPWKKTCKDIRATQEKYVSDLVERCVKRIADDKRNGSYMEYLLDTEAQSGFDREATGYLGLSLLEGAGDTTAVYLQSFFLCLLEHPEVMAKVQMDIDDVIGADRTPELEDLEELPYVQAIINEVHRFCPILPTGIPHAASADTMVGEYLIPKGSTIFMNTWSISRDQNLFDEPDKFWPERFMKSKFGTKPGADTTGCREMPFAFGSGRRVCPGTTFAGQSIALNVMNLLWAFEIVPSKDPSTGVPISLSINNMTDGILLAPKPYTCDLKPRSEAKAVLIKHKFEASRHILERFDV